MIKWTFECRSHAFSFSFSSGPPTKHSSTSSTSSWKVHRASDIDWFWHIRRIVYHFSGWDTCIRNELNKKRAPIRMYQTIDSGKRHFGKNPYALYLFLVLVAFTKNKYMLYALYQFWLWYLKTSDHRLLEYDWAADTNVVNSKLVC